MGACPPCRGARTRRAHDGHDFPVLWAWGAASDAPSAWGAASDALSAVESAWASDALSAVELDEPSVVALAWVGWWAGE